MSRSEASIAYRVPRSREAYKLQIETFPESVLHDQLVTLLKDVLTVWAKARGNAFAARNLAIRWDDAQPVIGVDPDVCLLVPQPPETRTLQSVRTWLPGLSAPALAIEVVSDVDPHKDYVIMPEKYAASGTQELWIFDPLLAGPRSHGGPFRLQVWQRRPEHRFERTHAGDGPTKSEALSAWLVVVDGGQCLRIADDMDGARLWPTGAEAALARVAQLEAQIGKR